MNVKMIKFLNTHDVPKLKDFAPEAYVYLIKKRGILIVPAWGKLCLP